MTPRISTFGRHLTRWHRAFGERGVTVAELAERLRLDEPRLAHALRRAHGGPRGRVFGGFMVRRGGLAENADRKDFLPSEIDASRRAVAPIEAAAAKERMSEGGKGWKISTPSKTRDRVGAVAGVSGRQVEKIAKIVEAAERE